MADFKYYMLSSGEYSDYGVNGLYKSKLELDYEKLQLLRRDYAESIGIARSTVECDTSLDDSILQEHHMYASLGVEKPEYESGAFFGKPWDDYYKTTSKYKRDYEGSDKCIKVNFTEWLALSGFVCKVEYEEIHEQD